MHASEDFYDRGPWYDAVKALHTVPRTGPNRRLQHERSRVAQAALADQNDNEDEVNLEIVADVALLLGCYFCQIPEGKCKGQWHPMLYVQWMKYCLLPPIQVPEGEHAALARGADNLLNMGVECFMLDEHEHPYMLDIGHVTSMVYYQHGYNSPKAGKPDFYWVDTLWDCL